MKSFILLLVVSGVSTTISAVSDEKTEKDFQQWRVTNAKEVDVLTLMIGLGVSSNIMTYCILSVSLI